MDIAWPIYLLIPGILIQSFLAVYVAKKKREGRVAWAFMFLSFIIILWQSLYIFQVSSIYKAQLAVEAGTMGAGDIGFNHAIPTFDRLRYFGTGIIGPIFFYLVVSMFIGPRERTDRFLRIGVFLFPLIFLAMNAYSIVTSTPFLHTRYSISGTGLYEAERGIGFWYNMAYNYAFILMGFSILLWKTTKPSFRLQRKQAGVFFIGTIIAFVGNIQQVLNPGAQRYEWTPILFTLASIFFMIGIVRYKMFLIEPRAEKKQEGEPAFDLSMGRGFVVYEDSPEYVFEIFADMVKHAIHGMAFAPVDPKVVREKHNLEHTPILQTGEKTTPQIFSYASADERDYILYLTNRFSTDEINTIILLSGMDRFAERSPDEAKEMLREMNKIIEKNQSRLLVSIAKDASSGLGDVFSNFLEL